MARGVLRFALPLYLVFVALTVILHLRPYSDSALRALIVSSDNCAFPCWQGIRPGVTSGVEAVNILENHGWVDYVRVRGDFAAGKPGTITWTWSGTQPPLLRVDGGRVLIIDNVVEYVRLSTTLGFGDIWLGFDRPNQGRFEGPSGSANRPEMFHQASYSGGTLLVESIVYCPVGFATVWNTPVIVELRQEIPRVPWVDYKLARWVADPAC
jgi:hypothetical protein